MRGNTVIPVEFGAIMTTVSNTIQPKVENVSLGYALEHEIVLTPFVSKHEAVHQARYRGKWYGIDGYERANGVVDAYTQLLNTIIERTSND